MAGIAYEEVSFGAADGILLQGWFMPFQDHRGQSFADPAPVVVVPSDGSDNMGSVLWHYFRFFRGAPWHVLAFDWRGFGKSAPWDIDSTYVVIPELVLDLDAAIEYAKARPECDGNLGIVAWGPAAAVAMATVAGRDDVGALVLRGAFTTQAEYCERLGDLRSRIQVRPNPDWGESNEPLATAPKLGLPVFITVGEEDPLTPPEMARRLYDLMDGPKALWIVPRAAHDGETAPEVVDGDGYTVRLHRFLSGTLGTGGL
jgi:pimeloyl-ACP methyl ester carboxylesterase